MNLDARQKMPPLVQIALTLIDEVCPRTNEFSQRAAQNAMKNYIENQISFDEAARILDATIFSQSPLIQIREILKIIDEIDDINFKSPEPPKTDSKKFRSWDKYEDDRLIAAVHKYGIGKWKIISEKVGCGRNRAQCSQRWYRALDPRLKKIDWVTEEDNRLLRLVKIYGRHAWTTIAKEMTGRSDVQCRYRYTQIARSKKRNKKETSKENSTAAKKKSKTQIFDYSNSILRRFCNMNKDCNQSDEYKITQINNELCQTTPSTDNCPSAPVPIAPIVLFQYPILYQQTPHIPAQQQMHQAQQIQPQLPASHQIQMHQLHSQIPPYKHLQQQQQQQMIQQQQQQIQQFSNFQIYQKQNICNDFFRNSSSGGESPKRQKFLFPPLDFMGI